LKPSQYISFFNSIEEKFPVNEWVIDGMHVWPLIRINQSVLWLSANRNQLKSIDYSSIIKDKLAFIISKINAQRKFLDAYLSDAHRNQSIKERYDAIFVSNTTLRRILIEDKWYDIFCDTFINFFENNKIKCCVLEFTPQSRYKTPRYRASKFIQPSFDLIPILSKFNGGQKCSYRLDGYHALQKLLDRKGLSNYLPDINYLFKKVKLVNTYKKFYLKIFSRIKPKIGFFVCYYGIEGMAFNLACREFGIPSVDIQHGISGDLHSAYGKWSSVPHNGYDLLPSLFWCWSEVEVESIKNWNEKVSNYHKPILGGNLMIRKWLSEKDTFQIFKEKAHKIIRNENINLLVTHQGIELPTWFIESIKKSSIKYKWFVRLHPRPKFSLKKTGDILKIDKLSNVDIENATNMPLWSLLECVDIHITQWSTTVLEAKQFGTPSIVIHENGQDLFDREIKNGTVKTAFSQKQLEEAISSLKSQKVHRYFSGTIDHSNKALSELLKLIKGSKNPTCLNNSILSP